jgi:hypothetical protein
MKSIQYTIRSVPEALDRVLRQRAEREQKSLNTVVLEALEEAVKNEAEPKTYHDLDHLIGTWVEDPAFDEMMEMFEQIDEEDWK